jgi:predicted ATPase
MYSPALAFIREHPVASAAQLDFGAVLEGREFEVRLWQMIARNVSSSFVGKEEGSSLVRSLVEETDFGEFGSVEQFLAKMDEAIHFNVRERKRTATSPFDLLRTGHDLEDVYNYIYGLEYVEIDYTLQASGVPIDRLSPGQKGTLLLMFYLLVDKNDHPLLLDQPDENLDNQTIMRLLVPAIKEAAQRRQIVIITHSPNVAIVADADQLVIADFDGESFEYSHGAIESPARNVDAVDILEGTWEAYINRGNKYQNVAGTDSIGENVVPG